MDNVKIARAIAFYLPQYHPIPENDKWWGKGFTEWTNVVRAKPLFKGHYQPHIPSELGFYDLRLPEIREQQAEMAKAAGIEGFCYWHYWFGNKKQLLEMPFHQVLTTGKPDFPFCLGWANHTWSSKTWHVGEKFSKDLTLIKQMYPGQEDHTLHFYSLLDAFKDKRYIKVNGKPIFVIFDPFDIPDVKEYIKLWRKLAVENGLEGFHFVGITYSLTPFQRGTDNKNKFWLSKLNDNSLWRFQRVLDLGFDAVNSRGSTRAELFARGRFVRLIYKAINKYTDGSIIHKYNYGDIIKHLYVEEEKLENVYPTLIPNWDRSPRSGKKTAIWYNCTPRLFGKCVDKVLSIIRNKEEENKIVFIQSWNEWGEGNHLEPDLMYGQGYLLELRKRLLSK